MDKLIFSDDHKEVILANDGVAYTVFERSDRQTKSASSAISRSVIADHMPPDGYFGVHAISMGAEDYFGFNRNGDSASERALKLYHPTFVKSACVFREHLNKNPRTQGIGRIAHEAYNADAHRGELIIHVSKDKAPDMYKKASAGEELSWSMSMRLPYDECSVCQHKARTPKAYCPDLKNYLGRYVPHQKKYAYARNEENVKFFDFSGVEDRADRIASYLSYQFPGDDLMQKAASANDVIGGAAWASMMNGEPLLHVFDPWEDQMLTKLATAEQIVARMPADQRAVALRSRVESMTKEACNCAGGSDFGGVAGALASKGSIMDFPSFARTVCGDEADDEQITRTIVIKLPSLFSGMKEAGGAACGGCGSLLEPDTHSMHIQGAKDPIDNLMEDVGEDMSMKMASLHRRALPERSGPRIVDTNVPQPDAFHNALAEAYGVYVVKAARMVQHVPDVDVDVMCQIIALQNAFS